MPTPPAPAWISAVSPAFSLPNSKRQSSAVPTAMGTQAASSRSTSSGTTQVLATGTARRSAWEPLRFTATTRWPTLRSRTSAPTSAATPAHWYPTI